MQEQPINPPQKPCPVCGADPQYLTWSQTIGYSGGFEIKSYKHTLFNSRATPLICTICGYVQFFVNPEDFRTSRHLSNVVN